MLFKNGTEVGYTPLRRCALDIIEAGVKAVLPSVIIPSAVTYFQGHRMLSVNGQFYNPGNRIFVIGGGKAGGTMTQALEKILPESLITDGLVITKDGDYNTRKIKVVKAGHPVPDARGELAVKAMLSLKERYAIGQNDTVICLLSGGGSALMPYPAEGISLADKQLVTALLISCGAEITEINAVRKHLSRVKGGRLGQYFSPAQVITLIISDVTGNDLSTIASGPTYPDPTTFDDALSVLDRYQITGKIPSSVISYLDSGITGKIMETPKSLDNCHNYIIADSSLALEAMFQRASELGFKPLIITAEQTGETTSAALQRAHEIIAGRYDEYDALIMGGETTPVLTENHGIGGRNQHFVGVSMQGLKDYAGDWVVASVGTDGSDFMPGVGGAIADNSSWQTVCDLSIDIKSYLQRYDSNSLMKSIGECLLVTGETGTNVGDVMLYLLKRRIRGI